MRKMEKISKEKRSKIMSAIRSRNTRPELLVRKYLFARGFRYRINHPRLPGHPDIVLRKYRTCTAVSGMGTTARKGIFRVQTKSFGRKR